MFWGLILKANRKYTQKIKKSFHLSQAALDITNSSNEPVQVILISDNHNYILCTLRKNKTEQVALDLNFAEGDEISFTNQGNGNVHLSGYLVPQIDDVDVSDEEEEEYEENEEIKEIVSNKEKSPEKLKRKHYNKDEDESDQIDQDEDEDEDEETEKKSDEAEDEIKEPQPKHFKKDKTKQNGLENGSSGKGMSVEKSEKESGISKGVEKVLEGGVKIEDLRMGNGPEAKPGKKLSVFYEGRLKSNNKIFDSCKQGAGFKFGLGKGEVIRGWDVGFVGMKVGGKRRIICPPKMAYGAKGSPPVIPPNSTLVFEVELKGVN